MRALAALPRMRRRAESRMTSTATIRRATGEMTEVAGEYVMGYDTLGTSPVRIDGGHSEASPRRSITVADDLNAEVPLRTAHLPHDVDSLLTDPLADGDYLDTTLGTFRVIEATAADQQTARRVPVVGVDRPTEWGA